MRTLMAAVATMFFVACGTASPRLSCATESGCEPRTFAVRLKPGEDLRRGLQEFAAVRHLDAAYVATCAGSLKVAAIRFADQKEANLLQGPLEILSVTGTLSADGPHLHISVADSRGQVTGGHLAEGSIVYTTAEVAIVELTGAQFRRVTDPETTFKELSIE